MPGLINILVLLLRDDFTGFFTNAVYMSQYQLIPYDRVRDHFQDQMQIPVSAGSVFNFNKEAYDRLELFGQ